MSTAPINAAGAGPAASPTPAAAGTSEPVHAGEAISTPQEASPTEGSPLSANIQVSMDALSDLSTRDLLMMLLLSMLDKDKQDEKSSLAPALLLLGAASMQANISVQFSGEMGAGATPSPASAPETTGGNVDVSG